MFTFDSRLNHVKSIKRVDFSSKCIIYNSVYKRQWWQRVNVFLLYIISIYDMDGEMERI